MARYKRHIFICENQRPEGHPKGCCAEKHSAALTDKFKVELRKRGVTPQFRINKAGCLDACEYGPVVVVYPDGVWYGCVSPDDVEEIIDKHIIGGETVARLMIRDARFAQEFE